jgi:hypothetical protein
MGILADVKVMVGPLVFRKDGQPSCGFGSDCRTVVIMEKDQWDKMATAINALEARLAEEIRWGHRTCVGGNCMSSGTDCPAQKEKQDG